jgi:hypothetical protein
MKLNGTLLILDSKIKGSKHTLFNKLKHKLGPIHRVTSIFFKPINIINMLGEVSLGLMFVSLNFT